MMPNESTPMRRRSQAANRALSSARALAERRMQGFLDAAIDLINSRSDSDFTIQEVVEL